MRPFRHHSESKLNGFKRGLSDNRVLVELVERVLEARRKEVKGKRRSWHPAERFRPTSDPKKVKKWGDATGRFNLAEWYPGLGRGGGLPPAFLIISSTE